MTAEPCLCWIDTEYDRVYASDGVSRYGAYLALNASLFEPWRDQGADGVTLDPVDFATAAFNCATGPVMAPGYVRWHGRVYGNRAGRSDHDGRLLLTVSLATLAPRAVPWSWRGWERQFDGTWWEPNDARPAALAYLELRWPVATERLHQPARPDVPGRANLRDARRAVACLVDVLNEVAGPVLAELEGSG
jgi:hypothetical protein